MSARVDADGQAPGGVAPQAPFGAPPPSSIALDPDDRWGGHALPSDHPAWMKDTLSISQRARGLLAQMRPAIVKVIAYWEHRVRSVIIGERRVFVDASGSYRME
jgi:hypothetical protein